MSVESVLAEKFEALRPVLDERQWRLLLGAEARALGHGGIAVVARVSGAARSTVSIGLRQVRAGVVVDGRVRAPGGGRRPVSQVQPGVEQALDDLVAPATRGDPMSLLRWTNKSLRSLTKALSAAGFIVSMRTVGRMLRRSGYRLHAVFKTTEGRQHPDRDAQFCYIDVLARRFLDAGDPVVSLRRNSDLACARQRPGGAGTRMVKGLPLVAGVRQAGSLVGRATTLSALVA